MTIKATSHIDRMQKPVLQEIASHRFKKAEFNIKIALFGTRVFQYVHSFGSLQTKPMTWIVEKFQQLKYRDSFLLTKVQMSMLAIFSIPIAIVSIPGFMVCAFAKSFRNKLSYTPQSQEDKKISFSTLNELKIMSWNTGLGPGFMSIDNRLKKPQERVDSIIATIESQDPHVLALQEVFDEETTELLVQQLTSRGYDCVHSVLSSSAVNLNSGLFMAVKRDSGFKLEIEEITVWQFTNLEHVDAYSNKGLLGLRAKLTSNSGQSKNLHLFNTHLQSSYEIGYGSVRNKQVEATVAKINEMTKKSTDDDLVILAGDFNFGFTPLEKSDIPESKEENEYEIQMQAFAKAGLHDPNATAQYNERGGTFFDLKTETPHVAKSVVDYILTNNRGGSSEIINIDPTNPASDHCAVIHRMSMTLLQQQPAQQKACEECVKIEEEYSATQAHSSEEPGKTFSGDFFDCADFASCYKTCSD